MSDTNFLQKAIQLVQQATEKDNAKEYDEALRLYQLCLEYFMTALKCISHFLWFLDEKNERTKKLIREKFAEYLKRAEDIKEFIKNGESGKSAVPSAEGGK
jgi:vacuolar protein-sorting-associated protein 4